MLTASTRFGINLIDVITKVLSDWQYRGEGSWSLATNGRRSLIKAQRFTQLYYVWPTVWAISISITRSILWDVYHEMADLSERQSLKRPFLAHIMPACDTMSERTGALMNVVYYY